MLLRIRKDGLSRFKNQSLNTNNVNAMLTYRMSLQNAVGPILCKVKKKSFHVFLNPTKLVLINERNMNINSCDLR